jgi:GT2 family glycosyltransferase
VGGDQLAVVTVTHNSERDLAELLAGVARHLPGAQMIVVDCASADGGVALARSRPGVEVIALAENVGFGRACNRGLRDAGRPVTALLNPDVALLDDSLVALAGEAARGDRPERILAPLVLRGDGSRQDTVHPAPCSLPDLVRALVPPAVVPGAAGIALAPWRSTAPRPVGWAVGCALLARTETLRRLGPFDESIFMYGEDMELGLRAAQTGVATWFWPQARVVHHGAHSSLPAFAGEPFERHARARHDVVTQRLGRRAAIVDDAAQMVTFASRLAIKRALRRPAERERRQLTAARSAAARRGREAGT